MLEKVKEIIAEQLDVDVNEINESTSFQNDLGADSLDLFQMIMALEEEFGVEIENEQAEKIKTVADVISYIQSKQ